MKKLRQDVKVTIQPALTGMSHVNVLSTGRSSVALVPGQSIPGSRLRSSTRSSSRSGLGPVERNHLSHTIAEVRQTVDSVGPRLQQMLGSLQETTTNLREMSDSIRPAVESTVGHVEDMTRKLNANSPRLETIILHVEGVTGEAEGYLVDNRENVQADAGLGPRLHRLAQPDRWPGTSPRSRSCSTASRCREPAPTACSTRPIRSPARCRPCWHAAARRSSGRSRMSATPPTGQTSWSRRSSPTRSCSVRSTSRIHEDLRVQAVYDTALVFTKGAQELHDAVKTLEAMSARPATPQQQEEMLQLQQNVRMLTNQLNETSSRAGRGAEAAGRGWPGADDPVIVALQTGEPYLRVFD